jgi:hypothetical protein
MKDGGWRGKKNGRVRRSKGGGRRKRGRRSRNKRDGHGETEIPSISKDGNAGRKSFPTNVLRKIKSLMTRGSEKIHGCFAKLERGLASAFPPSCSPPVPSSFPSPCSSTSSPFPSVLPSPLGLLLALELPQSYKWICSNSNLRYDRSLWRFTKRYPLSTAGGSREAEGASTGDSRDPGVRMEGMESAVVVVVVVVVMVVEGASEVEGVVEIGEEEGATGTSVMVVVVVGEGAPGRTERASLVVESPSGTTVLRPQGRAFPVVARKVATAWLTSHWVA